MTVGDICKYLNKDDLIVITKPDGAFVSGFVEEMFEYFDKVIKHIGASISCRSLKWNNNIAYEFDVE